MDLPPVRKPKLYFDTAANPSHVTFDDGKELRRNIPWTLYLEARWDYAEPDTIKMEIGDWLVVISGHNLAPLFQAIEGHALTRVCAQLRLEKNGEQQLDTFATEIRFTKPPVRTSANSRGQIEFELPGR
jgi:hypothetical protein